ncbi:hypothetical protein [Nitrosovibrio sp. Nv6]|uniref:hypothetical protein n=1 Tax=Nitrosovibrio sp. Nv6 TaxID=1855340 RepID=UPI0008C1DFD3|nr:hypothetical protein [Nitrosovibrio sp. Nv6]SEO52609.1 hypothetical protein SAMN05216316_0416 [Nitrosovibrio sp. Nv6]
MRYLVGALFLASCTMLAPSPTQDGATDEAAPVVDSEPPESGAEASKLKPKPLPTPTTRISSCANLDAGNLKETIKAKLDCIEENAK